MADRKKSTDRKRSSDNCLRCADLVLDLSMHQLTKGDSAPQHLTPKECRLLETFMRNRGDVLSRKFLMREVWEYDYDGDTRTLEVHVSWLRSKIEDDSSNPRYLHTVRGTGYWFEPNQNALEES
ncbi:MAG: Sensory transduction protein regX3 [Anaerolineales bacterium]|nr:Sensory transduction protein regX3 [Anaerolineales bacterium]